MTALLPFTNGEFELSVSFHEIDGLHVQATGLAKALGFREAYDLLRTIPDGEKGSELARTLGGEQMVGYVTEAGFYRALGQRQATRVKDAGARADVERFQAWVYRDVLPSLRRGEIAPVAPVVDPASLDRRALAMLVIEAEDARAAAEHRVAELEPRAAVADALLVASGDISVREAAQVLTRDHGIEIGQNRLFAYLRELRWLDAKGMPYQQHVEAGRVALFTGTYDHPISGEPMVYTQARVTPRGLAQLHGALTAGKSLAVVR